MITSKLQLSGICLIGFWGLLGCTSHFGTAITSAPQAITSHTFSSQSVAQPYFSGAMTMQSSSLARVKAVGTLDLVYDSYTQGCSGADMDIPDTPMQAYRDANGQAVLTISHYTGNYRDIGPDLNSVQHSCQPSFVSVGDTKFADDLYHQWISAPYTLDGTNIVALVHNEWYPSVTQPNRCNGGWANAIDFISSSDSGASFSVPDDYKVRTPGTPWQNSYDCQNDDGETVYGSFLPSGITDGHDGYYYSYFRAIAAPNGVGSTGECVMRASELNSASDWNVWTGTDWQPAKSTPNCGVINFPGMPTEFAGWINIKYSTFFNKFIVLMDNKLDGDNVRLHYALSDDLINWSQATPLALELDMGTNVASLPQYFSFLDPSDTSRNFENIGADPYIYFVIFGSDNLDRQVVRQQIHFAAPAATSASNSSTASSSLVAAVSTPTPQQSTTVTSTVDTQAQLAAAAAAQAASDAAAQAAAQAQSEAQMRAAAAQAAQDAQAAVQAAAQVSAAQAAAAAAQAVAARQTQPVYRYVSPAGYHAFILTSDGAGLPAQFTLEGAVFNVYVTAYANTTALYRCSTGGHQMLSTDPGCEGQTVVGLLGYVGNAQAGNLQALYRMSSGGDFLEGTSSDEGTAAGYNVDGILGYVP